MLNRVLKKKNGDVLILGLILIIMALFLITFIVDFGKTYIYKVQAQNITDAAALAGAGEGKHGYASSVLYTFGEKRAEVLPGPAKSAANKVVSANRKHLPQSVTYNNVQYNKTDKRGWNSEAQFLNGDFNVDANSSVKTTFLNNGLNKVNIPFLTFKTHAKVHVSPR